MEVFVDEFYGQKVLTVICEGRVCWLAVQMATVLEYDEPSKAISYCLKVEEFEKGIEYDVLSGAKLKDFKNALKEYDDEILKFVPKVVIFYEEGLFGFLQFSHKPIGAKLRKWIRKEVKPKIMKRLGGKENYLLNSDINSDSDNTYNNKMNLIEGKYIEVDKLNNNLDKNDFDIDKFQRLRIVSDTAKMLKSLLDDVDTDSICKLAVIKTLFSEVGIELPIYFNKQE
ncbi:MAG: BRO-N domain-containing protein [Sarcina sp.]